MTGRDRRPFDPRLSIGKDLEGLVDACLIKEPDQRATAGMLLAMQAAERDRIVMEWIRSSKAVFGQQGSQGPGSTVV